MAHTGIARIDQLFEGHSVEPIRSGESDQEKELHDIFVSHSHRDKDAVRELVQQLKDWGLDVYVDFNDAALQESMNRKLAERLKKRIGKCRLFLFAFSEKSASSRWMPWELGLAHGAVGRVVL